MKFVVKKDIVIRKGIVLEEAPSELQFIGPHFEYIMGLGKEGQCEIFIDIDSLKNTPEYFEAIEESDV